MLEKLAHWQSILATQSPPEQAADGTAVTAAPAEPQPPLADARPQGAGAAAAEREAVPVPREGSEPGGTTGTTT
jgi:hypothetical protein